MIWDASQTWSNSGFLDAVVSDLGVPVSVQPTSTSSSISATPTSSSTTFTTSTTTTTSSAPAGTGTPVNQWGQCGGNGYTGSTACVAPYTCVELSVWWSQCE